jgi:hypothetical protein
MGFQAEISTNQALKSKIPPRGGHQKMGVERLMSICAVQVMVLREAHP